EAGTPVTAGDKSVGTLGSTAQGRGLAMLRLDRAADALAAGQPRIAGASKCAWSSPLGRNSHGPARRRQRNEPSPPPPRRPQTLSLAEAGRALRRLSRPGMGRAGIRRARALREANARRLPGRAVLDH